MTFFPAWAFHLLNSFIGQAQCTVDIADLGYRLGKDGFEKWLSHFASPCFPGLSVGCEQRYCVRHSALPDQCQARIPRDQLTPERGQAVFPAQSLGFFDAPPHLLRLTNIIADYCSMHECRTEIVWTPELACVGFHDVPEPDCLIG